VTVVRLPRCVHKTTAVELRGKNRVSLDGVRESAAAGRVVLWEESAWDGAQAKTLALLHAYPGRRCDS
jgi:hypothetical protein